MTPREGGRRLNFLYGRSARVMVLAAVGSALQMIYQIAWAWIFGSGRELDAFWVAASVPTFLLAVLPAVLTPVGVPLLTREAALSRGRSRRFEEVLRGNLMAGGAGLGAVLFLLAHPVASILARGMDPHWIDVAARLLRIGAIGLPLFFLIMAETVIQLSRERFLQVYASPVGGLVASTAVLLALHGRLGIDALAWAGVMGWGAQALALAPGGVDGWRFRFDPRSAEFRSIVAKGLPLSAAMAYSYCDVFVERIIASHLPAGSVTVLAYAGKIVVSSGNILGSGLVVTQFPKLSRLAQEDRDSFRLLLRKILGRTLLLGAAGLVSLVALAPCIVPLLFQHGSFGADAARLLAKALQLEGLVFFAGLAAMPLVYGFYALHDTRTVSIIAAAGFTAGAGMKIAGAWWGGVLGVATAASAYYATTLLAEAFLLERLHRALRLASPSRAGSPAAREGPPPADPL